MKGILALDFSPNGYQLASGSEDHSVRVWDLRKKQSVYTIPAHQSLVSQVPAHSLSPSHCAPRGEGCLLEYIPSILSHRNFESTQSSYIML